jgi:putative radical SAM enzyme (TIGR03279 family)
MRVTRVEPGGLAGRAGVKSGDDLRSVGGRELEDDLDLMFALGWLEEAEASFGFERGGEHFAVTLPVARPQELGIELEEPQTRQCGNACVFCFVDQLPRGLRASLYVKDEDYRLSFSYGNYVTLTNLTEDDYERIARLRLSPLYVSVHATDDAVRREMLGVDDAPRILDALSRLAGAGIRVHTQIVLVPGMNDGDVLDRSLRDLSALGKTVESVAVVPVGLTGHRDGLPDIEPVTAEGAGAALAAVAAWQERHLADGRGRTVYAADELYLLAGEELPPYEDYGDLPQLENGVGLLRGFEHELEERTTELRDALREVADRPLRAVLVTGELAAGFIRSTLESTLGNVLGLTVDVVAAPNTLFGSSVTVAGLLSGADMVAALRGSGDAGLFLLPAAAFNTDGLTLDGATLDEIASRSGRGNVVATDDPAGAIVESLEG